MKKLLSLLTILFCLTLSADYIDKGGGGGGGGTTIGGAVSGASADRVLFSDGSSNLGQKAGFEFDTAGDLFTIPGNLLCAVDGDCEIGVSGANRPGNIRSNNRVYVGPNADATAPFMAPGTGGADRLLFSAPGTQIEFNVRGTRMATYYDDGTYKGVQLDTSLNFGTSDNQKDIGLFEGSPALFGRPRSVYVGSDLYLGGTSGGSNTSTSIIYFGSLNTATRYINAAGTTLLGKITTDDNFVTTVAGGGLLIKEGTNAKMGTCTLAAGSCNVPNTLVTTTTRVFAFCNDANGGTPGALYVSARNAGTDFDIASNLGAADTCIVAWQMIEPAP